MASGEIQAPLQVRVVFSTFPTASGRIRGRVVRFLTKDTKRPTTALS